MALARELPFSLDCGGALLFEKGGDPRKQRGVAGILSAEIRDHQGEAILQKGMDFDYFLREGWFNDHHDKSIDGLIGYPERVDYFQKGATLPNGKFAPANCTWVEGYLLQNDPRADAVWSKGLALQGTGRSLAFSIEGKALLRGGPDGKNVLRANVWQAAITHKPVNNGTSAEFFFKALRDAETATPEQLEKAWNSFQVAIGSQPAPRRKPSKAARAVDYVVTRYPGISKETARRAVELLLSGRSR